MACGRTLVSVRVGAAISTEHDPLDGGDRGGGRGRGRRSAARSPTSPWCSPAVPTWTAPEATLAGVHESVIEPPALIGCGAGGVLGDGPRARVGNGRDGVGPRLDGGGAVSRFTRASGDEDGVIDGLPDARSARARDPAARSRTRSRPRRCCRELARRVAPATPVLGGLSSARTARGQRGACSSASEVVRGRRGRRALRRRRGAAVRVAGRGAARPRGDDHRRRGQRHLRARRSASARDRRADHRRARPARADADRRRTADRDRDRQRPARVRAGRLPRPRRARRRPRLAADRASARRATRDR